MSPRPDRRRGPTASTGSLVGAVGGAVFVLVNAGPLPGAVVLRVLVVGWALAVVVLAVRRPGEAPAEPSRSALRTYLACLVLMLVAIPVGAAVLRSVDHADLVLPWVVLVVGLHFLPFARAFAARVFAALGAGLAAVAVLGGAAVLLDVSDAAAATGVAAGLVILAAATAPLVTRGSSSGA